jgi:hypothetical protein
MTKLLTVALTALTTLAAAPNFAHAQKAREDSVTQLRARINSLRGGMTEHEFDEFNADQSQLEVARDLALSDGVITAAEAQAINRAAMEQNRRLDSFIRDYNSRSARQIRVR